MNVSDLYLSIRENAEASFSRSGGPGGQNVNKVNTKVTLRISVTSLAGLSEAETARLRELLGNRITSDDEIIVVSSEERSRRVNLERAYVRLEALIAGSARLPKRRRPVKPSRAAREERLASKRLNSLKKARRRLKPED
ncbi:MAG: aminoacyl-tRNA hydrolase [Treponema sp.]|jgi:ribosome-associated protein|nr:aminoacyl-tRNA hydrolase [Treponema sp.]